MYMKCRSCGSENRKKAKFCKECGEKITFADIAPAKAKGAKKSSKGLIFGGIGIVGVIAVAAAVLLAPGGAVKTVYAKNGEVRINLSDVSDGNAHYYQIQNGNRVTKFFLLKAADGQVRAALDACDVCYQSKKGYRQEGDVMVCNNCGNRFPADKINVVRGGCNPVPLDRSFDGEQLVISASQLEQLASYF